MVWGSLEQCVCNSASFWRRAAMEEVRSEVFQRLRRCLQLSDIMDRLEAFVDRRSVIMRNGLEEVVVKGAMTVDGIGDTRVVFLANAEIS
jgi:hypothetical protein